MSLTRGRLCVAVTNRKTLKLSNKDNPSRLRAMAIISNSHFVQARRCERHIRSRSFSLSSSRHEIVGAPRNFGRGHVMTLSQTALTRTRS